MSLNWIQWLKWHFSDTCIVCKCHWRTLELQIRVQLMCSWKAKLAAVCRLHISKSASSRPPYPTSVIIYIYSRVGTWECAEYTIQSGFAPFLFPPCLPLCLFFLPPSCPLCANVVAGRLVGSTGGCIFEKCVSVTGLRGSCSGSAVARLEPGLASCELFCTAKCRRSHR